MYQTATAEQITPGVFKALELFINQKPGLDRRNYYDPSDLISGRRETYRNGVRAYNSELASISKDGRRARKALKEAQEYPFSAEAMLEAQRAFSGRLSIVVKGEKLGIDYCAGQYFPTEYRKAAAAVLEAYIHAVKPKELPKPSDEFHSIASLEAANERAGLYWFSPSNKRFFRSRILPTLYKGQRLIWFVSSEKSGWEDSSPRKFTVRVFDTVTADVSTPGSAGQFKHSTAGSANAEARELAAADLKGEHIKPATHGEKCRFCGHYGPYCTGADQTV